MSPCQGPWPAWRFWRRIFPRAVPRASIPSSRCERTSSESRGERTENSGSPHGDDDLAFVIASAKEPERFRHFGELVRPVNHRYQFAGFKQLIHVGKVFVGLQGDDTHVLVGQ